MSGLKMKKLASIKGVIENLRGTPNNVSSSGTPHFKVERDLEENLVSEQFKFIKTFRHGFPFKPLSFAFDSVQKILAIGNKFGVVRLFGKPGVDGEFVHESSGPVTQILFIINSGMLLTAVSEDSLHLWDIRQRPPLLCNSLRLQKENYKIVHLDFNDKWIYIGTEKGNLYIVNLETFALSGYSISWNKLMDPLSKGHPGSITALQMNPSDSSKILIGFGDSGLLVVWDLTLKKADQRYVHSVKCTSHCWHMDGKQFVSSHEDGSLLVWSVKASNSLAAASHNKPVSVTFPHGVTDKVSGKMGPCDPIDKVIWHVNRSGGDPYFIFSGGLPSDVTGVTPSISFAYPKNTTLLEMEYCVLDFLLVSDSPYLSDYQEPIVLLAMLSNDIVAIDTTTSHFHSFKNPYAMDFNESSVSSMEYIVNGPSELLPLLASLSGSSKDGEFSGGLWPISGGLTSNSCLSYTELVITGHVDGSLRFWDSSSSFMKSLCRLKTSKYFDRVKKENFCEEEPFAITNISFCPVSKILAVSASGAQVIVFKYKKEKGETDGKVNETLTLEIPIIYEVGVSCSSRGPETSPPTFQHFEFPPRPLLNLASQSSSYTDPGDGFNFDKPLHEFFSPLRVRSGSNQRRFPGFHADLICLTPWVNGEPPSPINSLVLSSDYGLLAYGNGSGLVIVDIAQNVCLLNMGSADLYGSQDPFIRLPKSPLTYSPNKEEILRVDLSNYSQVPEVTPETKNINVPGRDVRVISPDHKRLHKSGSSADDSSSFSKSSSIGSLDTVIASEAITSLSFFHSYAFKSSYLESPCLYVGTNLGSLLVIVINLPEGELRSTEPVVVSPSGSLFRLRGSILNTSFLDCSLHKSSPPLPSLSDRQMIVVCTEKCGAVFTLPSQRQIYVQTINESSVVLCSSVINFGGSSFTPVLVTYSIDGSIRAYSLPSLRPLYEFFLQTQSHYSKEMKSTFKFADFGHALYFCNPTELQKLSLCSDFAKQLSEISGLLFQDGLSMPEAPKQSFLKGLFGGGPKVIDRDELFGESAGKASSNLVKHIPGIMAVKTQSAGSEISKAKMAMMERGQKLNELEDRTEMMANEAKNYAATAHKLKQVYQNKKWYQI